MRRRLGRRSRGSTGNRRRLQWQKFYASDCGILTPPDTIVGIPLWIRPPSGRPAVGPTVGVDYKVEDDWTHVRTIISGSVGITHAVVEGQCIVYAVAAGIIEWDGLDDTLPAFADVPDPNTEGDFDWLWWSQIWRSRIAVANGTLDLQFELENPQEARFMTRAQRKLSAGNGLLFVLSAWNLGFTATSGAMGYGVGTRNLYKLP